MKNIFKIFKMDLKHVATNAVAMVVIIGICVLPALYSWFNVAANWDPYGNTGEIKVVVYNNDKGFKNDTLTLNAGDQIVSSLKENKDIGWEFAESKNEAIKMAESGECYAAIIIPENFSKEMTSVLDGDLKIPAFDYYVNEKKNAIAPKITDKGSIAIQQQVNQSFVSVVVETIADFVDKSEAVLNKDGKGPLDGFISTLNTVSSDLDTLKNTIVSFEKMSESVENLVNGSKDTLPDLTAILNNSKGTVTDVTTLMNSTKSYTLQINTIINNIFSSINPVLDSMSDDIDSAIAISGKASDDAIDKLKDVQDNATTIINVNNQLISALQSFENANSDIINIATREAIDNLIEKLNNANTVNTSIINDIGTAITDLQDNKKINDDTLNALKGDIKNAKSDLTKSQTYYLTVLKPALDNAITDVYTTLGSVSGLIQSASNGISALDSILDGSVKSINSASEALNSTSKVVDGTKAKIDRIVQSLSSVNSNEQVSKLMDIIKEDPDILGDYVSSPVQINTHQLFEIKNYGSAMAPFYSTLAIWVGGIVMVAILKVKVNQKDQEELDNPKPHQLYFGRLMTFIFFGLIQATIITLGCLLYLQIQCVEPFFFVLSGIVSSIVFVTIIYTLTISFGDIGKAICVVLLVIQIGGSGGTFPIELTPPFFQSIYPWMPFTYGIDAMRECVAGFYHYAYLENILTLLLYIPFALLLGLVLRKPLIKVNTFIEERLEDTGFM